MARRASEAQRRLSGRSNDGFRRVHDLLGPTSLVSARPGASISVTVQEVASAAAALAPKLRATGIPAAVSVGGLTLNAAEFLEAMELAFLACLAGAVDSRPPLSVRAQSMIPVEVAKSPSDDLTQLQFWTYKPVRWSPKP